MPNDPDPWEEEKRLREGDDPVLYERRPHTRIYPHEEAAWGHFLARYLPDDRGAGPPRILEVGAGTGLLTKILLECFGDAEVTALDAWEEGRRYAEAVPTIRAAFQRGRLGWLNAPTDRAEVSDLIGIGSLDLVVCRLAVCSFPAPPQAFANWMRWLRDGSHAVILDRPRTRDNWTGPWEEQPDRLPLACAPDAEPYREHLRRAGFEVVFAAQVVEVNRAEADRSDPGDLSPACTPWYAVVGRKPPGPIAAPGPSA